METHVDVSRTTALAIAREYNCALLTARRLALSTSAAGKLASALLDWARMGDLDNSPARSNLPISFLMQLTHEELGSMAGLSRGYALKNQDRLIRLEEQLRLADLLPEDQLSLIDALTVDQFVGLRFASDAEVAALAHRAVTEHLDRKQIKQAITTWRPDNQRI